MYLNQMIAQVPQGKPYRKRHLQSVPQMLQLINEVLTMAPEFSEDALVMTPLGAILDWAMGTPAGFAAFRDRRINAMFGKILTAWCEFLSSGDSRYVLNDSASGWKCAVARRAVGIEQYQYDPGDKYWGFASWNDFFTRRFKEARVRSTRRTTTRSSSARVSRLLTALPWTSSASTVSGSRASRIRCRTCWRTTSPWTSSSAGPSIRRS
jgi:hypothetical protein